MRHLCSIILILAFLIAPELRSETVTIAGYNVENAFDVFDDPYTSDESTDVKQRWEWQAIARAIEALDADVVAFSELENEHVLRAMVSEFLPNSGYDYITSGPTNSTRGINLGLISRLPIQSVTSYRFRDLTLPSDDTTWRFARDLMRVTLTTDDGQPLDVFVVHYKSRSDSPEDPNSTKWRTAEAYQTREIIENLIEENPGARLAVVGDFNSTPGSPAISALLQSHALQDAHAGLPADQRVTYLKAPYYSTIDYLLVSPALGERLVPASAVILSDAELLKGSDHAPIAATFEFE